MSKIDRFMENLIGNFNNQEQFREKQENGEELFPFAEHINTSCNDKILNLPEGFSGVFLLEESLYTIKGKSNKSIHLFLFTEKDDGILLTSYEFPSSIKKVDLNYSNMPNLKYEDLEISEKFTPTLFIEKGEYWEGESESLFAPNLIFKLHERFFKDILEVSEVMEKNGKKTFGYNCPIIYKRI